MCCPGSQKESWMSFPSFSSYVFSMLCLRQFMSIYDIVMFWYDMGVSQNRDTPKWMFFFPWKPLFFNGWFGGNTHYFRKHLPIIPANVCLSIPIHSLHIPSTFRILFFSNFTKSVDLTAEMERWMEGISLFRVGKKKTTWCLEEMKTTWKKSSNPMIVQMRCNS